MLAAQQAFAVLGLLRGAQRLKRTIQNAAAKHAKRPEDFAPLLRVIKVCGPVLLVLALHGILLQGLSQA